MKFRLVCALALALAAVAPALALAQTPLDDTLDEHSAQRLDRMEQAIREMRAIVFQGRDTGKPVEIQPADTDSQFSAINDKLNDIEQSLTRINGELDATSHALDDARHEADSLREENGALKDRLAALEQKVDQLTAPGGPPPPPTPPTAAAAPAPPQDPAGAFSAARQAFAARDFATAQTGFQSFLSQFADSPRAPEAHYFLGKILLSQQDYDHAAKEDVAAIRQWPQTSWAPDAVLDLARALIGLKQAADACQTLGELDRRYPHASADVKSGALDARSQAQCS